MSPYRAMKGTQILIFRNTWENGSELTSGTDMMYTSKEMEKEGQEVQKEQL